MKKFVSFFLICVSVIVLCGCSARFERELKKVSRNLTNYTLEIEYNDNHTIQVNQAVDYVNKSNTNFEDIYFHLYANNFSKGATNKPVSTFNEKSAYPNGFSEGHIKINKLIVAGKEQDIVLSGEDYDILKVDVNNLVPNSRVKIEMQYDVVIPNCLHRLGYGDNTINVANFYPVACVYDGEWNLQPYNSNGDPFYSEISNYNITLTAPSNLVLATTGEIKNTQSKNECNVYNVEAKAVRDYAFVLSNKFSVVSEQYENVKIMYYYYNDNNFAQSLQSAVDSIKTFNKLYGEYPYSTFSVVKSNFIHGGMEFPNLVLISDNASDYNDYLNVIIHETAHQWWYGLVGNNQYSCGWLDEGLTDYSTTLFYKNNPQYGINMQDIVKNTTNSYVTFVEVYTKVLGNVDTSMTRALNEYDTEPEYVYMAYVKGMLLFDSLMENVGEDKFLYIMSKYFDKYKYSIATPEALIKMFEKYLGYDMRGFFDSWLNGKVVIKRVS